MCAMKSCTDSYAILCRIMVCAIKSCALVTKWHDCLIFIIFPYIGIHGICTVYIFENSWADRPT